MREASSDVSPAPVSRLRVSRKVALGRPLPRCPCFGSHRMSGCAQSSGCLKQCPASCIRLDAILSETFGSLPYSVSLGVWLDQWMFKTLRSIRVYVPSSDFSRASVSVQLSQPYSRIDSMVAMKKRNFRSLLMAEHHILDNLFRACQAKAFLTAMSFSELSTQEPKYLKSSTQSIFVPYSVC